MPSLLAIDTASPVLAVALDDGVSLRTTERECGFSHSKQLLPAIAKLLGEPPERLDGVIVVTGPGSYAGLRVGVATATALAHAHGCPVAGVPTLEAVAAAAGIGVWTAIHPAGRGTFAFAGAVNGIVTGPLQSARGDALPAGRLVGEGAGALGGREVTAKDRARAALALGRGSLRSSAAPGVVYLREPHITVPRVPAAAQFRSDRI